MNYVLEYLVAGGVTSLAIMAVDAIMYWRGKNDGVMDLNFLCLNVFIWPCTVCVLVADAWLAFRRRRRS